MSSARRARIPNAAGTVPSRFDAFVSVEKARVRSGRTVVFPGPTVVRKAALALRSALVALHCDLLILERNLELGCRSSGHPHQQLRTALTAVLPRGNACVASFSLSDLDLTPFQLAGDHHHARWRPRSGLVARAVCSRMRVLC